MVSEKVTVINKTGLHARPANLFVKAAVQHKDCKVTFRKGGRTFQAKSIVSVLSACVKYGEEIELVAEGASEVQALKDMIDAVNSGLGE